MGSLHAICGQPRMLQQDTIRNIGDGVPSSRGTRLSFSTVEAAGEKGGDHDVQRIRGVALHSDTIG
jgi:hypothetical protein